MDNYYFLEKEMSEKYVKNVSRYIQIHLKYLLNDFNLNIA